MTQRSNFVYLPEARRYVNLLYVVQLALPPVNARAWGQGYLRLAGEDQPLRLGVPDARVMACALGAPALNPRDIPLDEYHPDYGELT